MLKKTNKTRLNILYLAKKKALYNFYSNKLKDKKALFLELFIRLGGVLKTLT